MIKPYLQRSTKPNLERSQKNQNQSVVPPFQTLQQILAIKKKVKIRGSSGSELKQTLNEHINKDAKKI